MMLCVVIIYPDSCWLKPSHPTPPQPPHLASPPHVAFAGCTTGPSGHKAAYFFRIKTRGLGDLAHLVTNGLGTTTLTHETELIVTLGMDMDRWRWSFGRHRDRELGDKGLGPWGQSITHRYQWDGICSDNKNSHEMKNGMPRCRTPAKIVHKWYAWSFVSPECLGQGHLFRKLALTCKNDVTCELFYPHGF